ncbi:MAG: hypothetical protein IT264_10185 [Saprospiraceae bacterium]|nr:hypothetical protein [Saprospiraceae bacterium]HRG33292.1 hypothetical protein [Saprospiraceae bacterium]
MKNINTYRDWEVEEEITDLCRQSFILQNIQLTYYILLTKSLYKIHPQISSTWINKDIGNISIQFNEHNIDGVLLSDKPIKTNIANALKLARLGIWTAMDRNLAIHLTVILNAQYKIAGFENFQFLLSVFPSISVGSNVYPGVTPSSPVWNCN